MKLIAVTGFFVVLGSGPFQVLAASPPPAAKPPAPAPAQPAAGIQATIRANTNGAEAPQRGIAPPGATLPNRQESTGRTGNVSQATLNIVFSNASAADALKALSISSSVRIDLSSQVNPAQLLPLTVVARRSPLFPLLNQIADLEGLGIAPRNGGYLLYPLSWPANAAVANEAYSLKMPGRPNAVELNAGAARPDGAAAQQGLGNDGADARVGVGGAPPALAEGGGGAGFGGGAGGFGAGSAGGAGTGGSGAGGFGGAGLGGNNSLYVGRNGVNGPAAGGVPGGGGFGGHRLTGPGSPGGGGSTTPGNAGSPSPSTSNSAAAVTGGAGAAATQEPASPAPPDAPAPGLPGAAPSPAPGLPGAAPSPEPGQPAAVPSLQTGPGSLRGAQDVASGGAPNSSSGGASGFITQSNGPAQDTPQEARSPVSQNSARYNTQTRELLQYVLDYAREAHRGMLRPDQISPALRTPSGALQYVGVITEALTQVSNQPAKKSAASASTVTRLRMLLHDAESIYIKSCQREQLRTEILILQTRLQAADATIRPLLFSMLEERQKAYTSLGP